MIEKVYNKIKEIEEEKKRQRLEPFHALYFELLEIFKNEGEDGLKKAINKLILDKRLIFGNTINDRWLLTI